MKNNNKIPKRILIFSLQFHPFIGGAEIAIDEITERLSQYEFDMITLRLDSSLPREEKIGNVRVHRIGFVQKKTLSLKAGIFLYIFSLNKILFPFLAFFKALSLHRKNPFAAIWAIVAGYAGFAALFFKFFHPKVPYVLTLQEGDPVHHIRRRVRFIHPIWQFIFLKADVVQAISTYLASFARDVGYERNVEVIPNGVDLTLFTRNHPPHEVEHLKNMLGKRTHLSRQTTGDAPHEDDILLVTASRLVPKNGVEDIIRSLIYLPKKVSLLVIGDGFLMKRLKFVVEELNLSDRVRFEGSVLHDALPLYLCVSDIFIRPSLSEGFGNSFVEAMAMRVPVIATPVGGITDFIFDPYRTVGREPTGLFCAVNNPKSIAYGVRVLLSDEKLRNRIVDNAEKMVREKYDWNIVARAMDERVFKKVLG